MLSRIIAFAILLGCSSATAQQKLFDLYEPQVFQGLPVRVMKPIDFDADQKYPVILSLHGAGGVGTNNQKQLKDWNRQLAEPKRRKEFPCYVVAPQADSLWDQQDLERSQALIKTLPAVDMNRIYVMGHSMGGHGTYIFIQLAPDYFAAAAPSAGSGRPRTEDFIDPAKIKDIPIWAFHGDRDTVCPIAKDLAVFNELKRLKGNMKLTVLKGDRHNSSGKMIPGAANGVIQFTGDRCDREPDFMSWMFAQSKPAAKQAANSSTGWKKHVVLPESRSQINSAVANDFDSDGHIDIISSFDGRVVLFKGPDWTQHTLHVIKPGLSRNKPRPSCIHSCLMDIDQDGDLDFCGSNLTVFWLECPADPCSGQPWTYRTIDDEILGTHCLISGDVNQDGKPDLIANSGRDQTTTSVPNSLTWLEVPSSPHTAKHWIRHVFADGDAPGASHYTGIADINGDGIPDISCGAKGGEAFPNGEWFAWWEQPADGSVPWKKHLLSDQHPGATNIHPVEVNGDKHMDLVATRGHDRGVLWFKGPDFREFTIDPNILGPHCLATVDLDDDGDIDLATCGRASDGTAIWYQNDGQGHFTPHVIDVDQSSYDIRAIDMDGDGDLDLLIAGHDSMNLVWCENTLNEQS